MKESQFQKNCIDRIKTEFPGCMVLKNDSGYLQGIPDFLVLHNNRWAALEFKRAKEAAHRPNQDYYVSKMNGMSYASFVDPSNVEEVMNGLQEALGSEG